MTTPDLAAKRILAYARAQADELSWTDRYACFNQVIAALAGIRDEPSKSPSGFMRAVAVLREANESK